jgi:hypothetical protein
MKKGPITQESKLIISAKKKYMLFFFLVMSHFWVFVYHILHVSENNNITKILINWCFE